MIRTPSVGGLGPNWKVLSLLVLANAFVGTMVGAERTLVPLLGETTFSLGSKAALLSFIVTFGVAKAISNLLAGTWSENLGRRRVLIAGWAIGLPVPVVLMFAPPPHWWLVVFANLLLGINQGLCWTMTLVSMVDIAGERNRGLVAGLNEFAGYAAVAVAAFTTGYLATQFGVRPVPFLLGVGAVVGGLALSIGLIPETVQLVRSRADLVAARVSLLRAFSRFSFQERVMIPLNQAGLFNNFNDGVAWGLFPVLFATAVTDTASIGFLVALYPLTWGISQLGTGPLSDRIGRKGLVASGLVVQSVALIAVVEVPGFSSWATLMILFGLGTAMVYPTLISAVGDAVPSTVRASALGVYRFWRDSGSALGALTAGLVADLAGLTPAILMTAAVTLLSGIFVALASSDRGRIRPARGSPERGNGPAV